MSKIEPIEDVDRIREIYQRLFKSQDAFEIPFQPETAGCIVFYPTTCGYLTRGQYEVVTTAAKISGDKGFVLSEIFGDFMQQRKHWWCEFPAYEDYVRLGEIVGIDNALYSINARWGVAVASEDHALVGGPKNFIRNVDKMYPEWRTSMIEVIDGWKGELAQGMWAIDMFIELVDYWWKKYPGDEWSAEVAEKFNSKLHGSR